MDRTPQVTDEKSKTPRVDAVALVTFGEPKLQELARALERALASSEARVVELEQDARRYRWLRDENNSESSTRVQIEFSGTCGWIEAANLDEPIDAAIAGVIIPWYSLRCMTLKRSLLTVSSDIA